MPKKPKNTQFDTLSDEAKALHARLVKEWQIVDAAGLTTLMVAMQAMDRMHEAQAIIRAEGIVSRDRFGQSRPHAATQIEKEAGARLLQAMKHLNLDLESLQEEETSA